MTAPLTKVISEAIKEMSARDLGELLAELAGEFGVGVSISSADPSALTMMIPPGWMLVPKRMTEAMVRVAGEHQWGPYSMDREVRKMWDAILEQVPPWEGIQT